MRRIRVEQPSHHAWRRWIRACESATRSLVTAVATGGVISFKEKLHRPKTIRRIYFFSRDALFFGKCAYCEGALELIDGDVDHFRPKGAVSDQHGKPITIDGDEFREHQGYYWLAYDWRNLLPSCKTCNQIYKGSQFPVEGKMRHLPPTCPRNGRSCSIR